MPTPESLRARVPADWWVPEFSHPRVRALMTGRAGGVSAAPFDRFNLRTGLGDAPAAVQENRARLHAIVGRPTQLLVQVHGVAVHVLDRVAATDEDLPVADAVVTEASCAACEIQVADCLPVLFAHVGGRAVGAAHAGWRGLAGGVLEATLAHVCRLADAPPGDIECWLGPCIGPARFEVGADVLRAFGATPEAPGSGFQADLPGKWLADLPALARQRLHATGVAHLHGNDGTQVWCTLSQPQRYFSYRHAHAGRTGRMAALIWLD
ncbi:peptidoglycan editing factor PgeF [Sphaerotilus sp.]|uniref:peptidoglycan editing factor PgeF n=1 Tax=Sphaerotilus sp. TaxID=2093942 RepID=UPI002ACD53C0|nr:peptidoglycan editing factor PgeF [Sphaerotilus sp.]MDZ7858598.1 peptidoglycan editing factor PgeF [Sphaerotilus sp.]